MFKIDKLIKVLDTFLFSIVTVFFLSTKNRSLQTSPDCSGYAILQRSICSQAIAFERKAGPKVIIMLKSFASKNINALVSTTLWYR